MAFHVASTKKKSGPSAPFFSQHAVVTACATRMQIDGYS